MRDGVIATLTPSKDIRIGSIADPGTLMFHADKGVAIELLVSPSSIGMHLGVLTIMCVNTLMHITVTREFILDHFEHDKELFTLWLNL